MAILLPLLLISCRASQSPLDITCLGMKQTSVWGSPQLFCSVLTVVFYFYRFMAMVVIEFGSLTEFVEVARNYHTNINKLYGNYDEFTLAVDKVVRNIIVSMYVRYINLWPFNGACVGHRALLMRSMLEFAFIYGHYCCREQQLKCFWPAPEMNDP